MVQLEYIIIKSLIAMLPIYLFAGLSNLILSLYAIFYLWLNINNWPMGGVLLIIQITLLFNTYFFFREIKLRMSKARGRKVGS